MGAAVAGALAHPGSGVDGVWLSMGTVSASTPGDALVNTSRPLAARFRYPCRSAHGRDHRPRYRDLRRADVVTRYGYAGLP